MKAYLLEGIGKFKYREVEEPVCGENEVIVEVRAAGICGSDIPRIYRTGTYSYPLIPGHEFSGIVSEAGGKVDKAWVGKRVGIFPLLPCGKCNPCEMGQYELCRSYGYLGSRSNGGFAEYVKVPVWNLLELPDKVSFEQAAMLEPMAVAVHAMRRSGVSKGDTAAISGLGTIGLLLYMLLADRGIETIYLIGNKEYQRKMAIQLGADERYFCNNRMDGAKNWLNAMCSDGVDVFFDCAGVPESAGTALRNTAANGRAVLVGNPASDMAFDQQTYWKILRNQLTVTGTWNSSFSHEKDDDWHYCLDFITRGKQPERLISHKLSFDRLAQGTEMMRDKKEPFVKVMTIL